jgi:diaminopimelate epimerase
MIVKAHAFGNDFVLVESRAVQGAQDLPALAQAICARHRGIGADGLIVYSTTPKGASMRLLNADGSRSEVSGNGVRCLGAWIASQRGVAMPGQQAPIEIQTDAGVKRLELLSYRDGRYTFRAAMGAPEQVAKTTLDVDGTPVEVVTLRSVSCLARSASSAFAPLPRGWPCILTFRKARMSSWRPSTLPTG